MGTFINLGMGGTKVTDSNDDLIDGDNPIASLSHDQKVQFTTARYLGDMKSSRHNATKAIRTSEFDIPKHELNKDTSGQ